VPAVTTAPSTVTSLTPLHASHHSTLLLFLSLGRISALPFQRNFLRNGSRIRHPPPLLAVWFGFHFFLSFPLTLSQKPFLSWTCAYRQAPPLFLAREIPFVLLMSMQKNPLPPADKLFGSLFSRVPHFLPFDMCNVFFPAPASFDQKKFHSAPCVTPDLLGNLLNVHTETRVQCNSRGVPLFLFAPPPLFFLGSH